MFPRSIHCTLLVAALALTAPTHGGVTPARPPNIVLIIGDDQGYGDVGWHGNSAVETPNLDRLAAAGTELVRFYVSPVCAPTRSALLTGRYNYRTRVTDTYQGRALMDPDERTLAEILGAAGYRCGIFGKWHLGDSAPMRPQDQGFDDVLVHRGGGIGQPSDPPNGTSYFDPVLLHNGTLERFQGYCSDVFASAAVDFIRANRERPFFLYLAFNAPHVPLEVPQEDLDATQTRDLSSALVRIAGPPADPAQPLQTIARVYAMIRNLDANVGRVLDALDSENLSDDTIVLFMTDNGPQQPRFNGGLRGLKGSVYEGGVRAPCVVRWPGQLTAGRKVSTPAAHIDVVPTLLEACGVAPPTGVALDGRSVWPLLKGAVNALPDRPYFVQWHRGDIPQRARACAVILSKWKLAQPLGVPDGVFEAPAAWQLFDLENDPGEINDLSAQFPERVAEMKVMYDRWFDDVTSTRGFDPPRIAIGSARENPVILTRQDWRAAPEQTSPVDRGFWEIDVAQPGRYRLSVRLPPNTPAGMLVIDAAGSQVQRELGPGATEASFASVDLKEGPARVVSYVETPPTDDAPSRRLGVWSVEITRLPD